MRSRESERKSVRIDGWAVEIVGWYGVAAILVAYAANSFGFLDAKGLGYVVLNLTGSVAIIVEAFRKKDVQPVVLNAIWSVVALVALIKLIV